MCGIFGVVGINNDAATTVFQGLKTLEYRGYDSWGVSVIKSNKLEVDKHTGKIGDAKLELEGGTIGLGHTRWATHGGVTTKNTHPHLDCSKTLAVVHNGIVENHNELRKALLEKGHVFESETDTEVIAHVLEEYKKEKKPINEATFAAFSRLEGSNAIAVLDAETNTIVAARNGSPLCVGLGENEYFLGSDVTPFLHKTNRVIFLDDGDGVVINTSGVKLFDSTTGKEKEPRIQTIDWKIEDAQKQGYDHYLLKEIMEQKSTISKTARSNKHQLETLAQNIAKGSHITLIGCGTAYFCALAGQYFFANQGIQTSVHGAYEFAPFSRFVNNDTIVIAISQSGETADTLIAAKEAKKQGGHLVALVNARGSTLERMADTVLPVGAGPEIAVVSTKAFTSQLATLYMLAKTAVGKYEDAATTIEHFSNALDAWLTRTLQDDVITLAKHLVTENDIYLIGKHENYPAVLEAALKIKETSYIHSESFASGELKDGVITLIQKGTSCIVFASNDEIKSEILSSATELKSRGGYIIGISSFKAPEFDYHIQTPDAGELTPIANIIVAQLLGYYLGLGRGTDPDKPRNLAKSVTVK